MYTIKSKLDREGEKSTKYIAKIRIRKLYLYTNIGYREGEWTKSETKNFY